MQAAKNEKIPRTNLIQLVKDRELDTNQERDQFLRDMSTDLQILV